MLITTVVMTDRFFIRVAIVVRANVIPESLPSSLPQWAWLLCWLVSIYRSDNLLLSHDGQRIFRRQWHPALNFFCCWLFRPISFSFSCPYTTWICTLSVLSWRSNPFLLSFPCTAWTCTLTVCCTEVFCGKLRWTWCPTLLLSWNFWYIIWFA